MDALKHQGDEPLKIADEKFYTVTELSNGFRIPRQTLYHAIELGSIGHLRTAPRGIRISGEDFKKWIKAHYVPPVQFSRG